MDAGAAGDAVEMAAEDDRRVLALGTRQPGDDVVVLHRPHLEVVADLEFEFDLLPAGGGRGDLVVLHVEQRDFRHLRELVPRRDPVGRQAPRHLGALEDGAERAGVLEELEDRCALAPRRAAIEVGRRGGEDPRALELPLHRFDLRGFGGQHDDGPALAALGAGGERRRREEQVFVGSPDQLPVGLAVREAHRHLAGFLQLGLQSPALELLQGPLGGVVVGVGAGDPGPEPVGQHVEPGGGLVVVLADVDDLGQDRVVLGLGGRLDRRERLSEEEDGERDENEQLLHGRECLRA